MLFGGDFRLWKLHTLGDYLSFFLFLAVGILVFMLVTKHMNSKRNHDAAVQKVLKKLKKLAGRRSRIYGRTAFRMEEDIQPFDGVLLDKSGIYLVRAYGWGTKIFGTPDGEMWRREDPKRKEEFPNPLFALKKGAADMKKTLEEKGISGIKINPLVVFADNYQIPELYLGYGSFSTTYQELKAWYKKQSPGKEAEYDMERVSSILKEIEVTESYENTH